MARNAKLACMNFLLVNLASVVSIVEEGSQKLNVLIYGVATGRCG